MYMIVHGNNIETSSKHVMIYKITCVIHTCMYNIYTVAIVNNIYYNTCVFSGTSLSGHL